MLHPALRVAAVLFRWCDIDRSASAGELGMKGSPAEANTVELVDQDALRELLLSHPVSMQELEHCVLG